MTLPLCNNPVLLAWAALFETNSSANGIPDEDVRKQLIREAEEKVEGLLERCNPVVNTGAENDDPYRPSVATESDIAEAVDQLEYANSMWQDDDMAHFQWIAGAFPQYHMMLYLLRYLCVCPRGPNASRAFAAVEVHLENFKLGGNGPLNGMKWTVLTTLREKALHLMQRVKKESAGVQEGQMKPQMCFEDPKDGSEDMQEKVEEDVAMPDWNKILEVFSLDMEDFSFIF
ncbi:hypothetical protein FOMG_02465 [Fusarium oxysporum f. sp. melonis 26406]|uniref:HAT C-terminal dimerisation domain-containing protein n=1 Tax=Fusarium oxysporum f. sp. melonis 26406 TaxID=1089452 RepID=X0AHB8_FUSOX|nr:hypothetical protein FOMG_02465 [Fusarium oxysporum f. sp. melonis 26406]